MANTATKKEPTAYVVKHAWSTKRGYNTSVSHKVGDKIKAADLEMTVREYPEGHPKAKTEAEQRAAHLAELVMIGCLQPVYDDDKKPDIAPVPVLETVKATEDREEPASQPAPTTGVGETTKVRAK